MIGAARAFAVDLPAGYRRVDPQRYFGRDPASFSERVTPDGTIRKAVWLGERAVELRISFAGDAAHCEIVAGFEPGAADLAAARAAASRILGMHGDPSAFETRFREDAILAGPLRRRPNLRIPLAADPFEALVWAIVGQQINLRFASRLRNVLGAIAGTPTGSGLTAQPRAGTLALVSPAELRARQFSQTKAEYVVGAARAIADGLPFGEISQLRGIGQWTAGYVELRGLGKLDSVPIGDSGLWSSLAQALGRSRDSLKPVDVASIMERYAPYRSFDTAHLWARLADADR